MMRSTLPGRIDDFGSSVPEGLESLAA